MTSLRYLMGLIVASIPTLALAAESSTQTQGAVADAGVSGIWMLANISYAGMRAQNNPSSGWRVVAFIFGFPGTLITFFAVHEGEERAYGIDIPKKL